MAVKAIVTPFSEEVIGEALAREFGRGGQAFFLHNRIETIFGRASSLAALHPGLRIAVAHGSMGEREIDEATGLPEGSVGAFLEASLDFVIIAFVMFLVVKAYNRARAAMEEAEEAAPEEPSEDTVLLREIRDSLNK